MGYGCTESQVKASELKWFSDIRDTVNYKEVMKQYGLGPNGGIVTALNLFSTKFGQVVDLIEKAGKKHKYCIIDTPGINLLFFFFFYY